MAEELPCTGQVVSGEIGPLAERAQSRIESKVPCLAEDVNFE